MVELSRVKIIILDTNRIYGQLLRRKLSNKGYQTINADFNKKGQVFFDRDSSEHKTINLSENNIVDLFIIDEEYTAEIGYSYHDLFSGIDICKVINKITPDAIIIFLSVPDLHSETKLLKNTVVIERTEFMTKHIDKIVEIIRNLFLDKGLDDFLPSQDVDLSEIKTQKALEVFEMILTAIPDLEKNYGH